LSFVGVQVGLLSAIWLALAASKALAPELFGTFVAESLAVGPGVARALAWMMIAGEALIGLALLGAKTRGPLLYSVGAVSLLVSLALLAIVLLGPRVHACGCFGRILDATHERRIVVGSSLVFLSAGLLRALMVRRARIQAPDPLQMEQRGA
jgi:hypothetical protein